MTYLIDLFLVVVIVITIFSHSKKGLLKTLQSLLAIVIALVLAFMCARTFTAMLSEKFVQPILSKNIATQMDQFDASALSEQLDTHGSAFSKMLDQYGISVDGIMKIIQDGAQNADLDVSGAIRDYVSQNAAYRITFIGLFAAVFILSSILLRIILRVVGFLDNIPILHETNHLLGGVLGLLLGLIYAFIFVLILHHFRMNLIQQLPQIFTVDFESETILYRLLIGVADPLIH